MFRRLTFIAGAMLVLGMLLAACGEDELAETPANGGGSPADPTATPSATETPAPEQPDLDGTAWVLAGFGDRDLDMDIEVTLGFDEGNATGNAPCNDYGAEYTASSDGSLSFGDIISTDMYCTEPDGTMDLEAEFFEALANVEGYTVDDSRLELTGADGETLLVFSSDEGSNAGLEDTSWLLVDFQGEPVPDEFEDIVLRFNEGQAGGTVCNSYGGTFEAGDDGSLTIFDVFQTEMYCTDPDGIMDFESSYLEALQNVATYQMNVDSLTLLDAEGKTLMTFALQERSESPPLDGSSWRVTEIDGEPVIDGTDVTAIFEDGMVTGSGGCNGYGGDYTATSDGEIDIHDAAMTLMACGEPEGVMDQETAFHTALRAVTAYETDGDTLQLLDDSGTVRLTLINTFDPDAPVTDEPSGLRGTTWVATAMNGEPLVADSPYTLQFTVNGPSGKAACASWWMQFVMEHDGTITHETRVAPSVYDAFCDDEAATAEAQRYVDTMANALTYIVNGNALHLMDEQGMAVLEFQRGQDGGELDGTSWTLATLNGEAPIDGTNLTLTFDFEWATGEGGCNGFGGAYMVVEPGTVVFAEVAHTDMGCVDPDGIMEQESAYFDSLYQVTGYYMHEDSLELLDAGGETILVFERQE